jgi:hypothetical protein
MARAVIWLRFVVLMHHLDIGVLLAMLSIYFITPLIKSSSISVQISTATMLMKVKPKMQ